ncbi:beta-lactamase family protein [Flavobacteriaceae bacterium TP-CH-4]|uniref:Beta-lactamase family protein n=1 Tax=Pelagihabitans pacificus TaxID=2696054 RepID=A0A967ECC5_9FLAO|nr:serine hydrolase domain-containing protein [Pelagihabitans pacificus]NHF58128.1 beta-lactamase family protein [Pelagihabitans pacificus]
MRLLLFFLLIWGITPVFSQSGSTIKTKIRHILEATDTPGAAVAIVRNDTLLFCQGLGYRDIEKELQVDAHTRFPIGSSTKAFTAALVGIAQELDSLDLERSPRAYLEEVTFNTEEMNRNSTIRDMMSHRTGLPRHDLSWYLFPETDRDRLVERLQYLQPFASVRQRYHYNNFTYMLLGYLAEKRLGASWSRLIEKHFFSSLGMTESLAEMISDPNGNTAIGYQTTSVGKWAPMPYYDLRGMAPAGNISSSASDMAQWLRCWLNNGKFNGKQVLPEAYVKEAISSQMVMRPNLPDEEFPDLFFSNYGFGWMLSAYKGHYRVEHGGNINGFSANVCFFPAESLGIVVLTNLNNSDAPYLIRNTLSDHFLKADTTDWLAYFQKEKEEKEGAASPETALSDPQKWAPLDISGSYTNKGYGTITIKRLENGYRAVFPIGAFPLERTATKHFQGQPERQATIDSETVPPLVLEIDTDANDTIQGIHIPMEPTLEPLYFSKTISYER